MLTISDSICVKVLSKHRLVGGVGNELRSFQNSSNANTFSVINKFNGKIHGIEYNGKDLLLVYTENEFILFKYENEIEKCLYRGKLSDWIKDGKILKDENINFVLLTWHSVALWLSYNQSTGECEITERSSCVDKSTLYSSIINGSSWSSLSILGGNALGEIIIWRPAHTIFKDQKLQSPVQRRFFAHRGAVFSIDINFEHNLIVTTSDDRSVKIWKFSMDDTQENICWEKCKIIIEKTIFGHTARVFKGKIIKNGSQELIISVGEDSNICIWNVKGALLYKKRYHFGATIWNFDYEPEARTIFSCGSDGNILCLNLDEALYQCKTIELSLHGLFSEHVTKIKFLQNSYIIGITNKNSLVFRKIEEKEWNIVNDFQGYKCTELKVLDSMIAIAGYKKISLYEFEEECLKKVFEGDIFDNIVRSFIFLTKTSFIICDGTGICFYVENIFQTQTKIELPISKERWLTSALKVNEYLFLSDRQGNLHSYSFVNNTIIYQKTLKQVHGSLGITMVVLEAQTSDTIILNTCGHDNTLKRIKFEISTGHMYILYTYLTPVAWIVHTNNTISENPLVLGFNDNHFVVWQKSSGIILQTCCGGGHRHWDLIIDEKNNMFNFVYIKNRLIYQVQRYIWWSTMKNNIIIPRNDWHIKECNVLKTYQLDKSSLILFSGGEDNILKCSLYKNTSNTADLKLYCDIYTHISSIKSIAFEFINENIFIFSAGGRAQICVTKFSPIKSDFEVSQISNFMFKLSDTDRKYTKNFQKIDYDPETRIMSIDVVHSKNFEVCVGCSDGYIRTFIFKNYTFTYISNVFYGSCILHVKISRSNKLIPTFLLTSATDGFVCLWDFANLNSSSKPFLKIKHHESGVNAIDMKISNELVTIISGGDDQTVTLSEVKYKRCSQQFELVRKANIATVHNSQINAITFSDCGEYFYTGGIDQRIFKICLNSLNVLDTFSTCIADMKGLNVSVIDGTSVCIVYGSGLQFFSL